MNKCVYQLSFINLNEEEKVDNLITKHRYTYTSTVNYVVPKYRSTRKYLHVLLTDMSIVSHGFLKVRYSIIKMAEYKWG